MVALAEMADKVVLVVMGHMVGIIQMQMAEMAETDQMAVEAEAAEMAGKELTLYMPILVHPLF